MKFIAGSMSWKTKKEAHEFFGRWLKNSIPIEIISDTERFQLLHSLLLNHPDATQKIGCGVRRFEIRQNAIFANQNTFWLIRFDGTETDFSFRLCMSRKENTPWHDFCAAARAAIADQIVVFKTAEFLSIEKPSCSLTGVLLEWDQCHVDHVVQFSDLIKRFVEEYGVDISTAVLHSVDGQTSAIFADDQLAIHWRQFHFTNAELRLTTPAANLARKRKS